MPPDITRRVFVATGLAALLAPRAAGGQAATIIDGKTFQGTRSSLGTKGEGGEGLRVRSNTIIRNCSFLDLGNGAVRVNVPVDDLVIEDCEARNLYRFLEDTSSNNTDPARLTNFAVRRVTAHEVDKSMTRIRYDSHNGVIEDVTAYGSAQGDLYCVGFQLDDQAYDITYSRVAAHGFRESSRPADRYWNGDGFSDERGNRKIRYLSCVASECSDGGFDLKSENVYLEDCAARLNKRNFRLWSSGELHRCISENPRHYGGTGEAAHFSFHGAVDRYVLDRPVVRAEAGNSAPVFLIATDTPLHLEIRDAAIDTPDAALFKVTGAEPVITWAPDRSQQPVRVLRERA
ncbi:hypothetical protein GCM10011494_12250 [Novosphingobium endophyticum]|uniref:Uncharacterized protein n=1 Tax=Novosphingobium endophyticum TaxID=1955250 RepID=A0A916X3W8_9SPHN|nr:hypothetical protein [Novosphingobium endophyticum]GGB95330.1 hypothetical protein GCM10011494_12250 [Novosphingobium endophyticum]